MPKARPGIISFTGRERSRKAVMPGSKKDEKALKENYSRTSHLNNLASELNTITQVHFRNFKSNRFYQALLSRFRREPLNNRFLLLRQLIEMEINPSYPLHRFIEPTVIFHANKTRITFNIQVRHHPTYEKKKMNSYYYELLLLQWNKTKRPAEVEKQLSEWVDTKKRHPEFEFNFRKIPGSVHWLLCVGVYLGHNKENIDTLDTQGMQIMKAGSFDKSDLELLEKFEEAKKNRPVIPSNDSEGKVVRVKAKRFHG